MHQKAYCQDAGSQPGLLMSSACDSKKLQSCDVTQSITQTGLLTIDVIYTSLCLWGENSKRNKALSNSSLSSTLLSSDGRYRSLKALYHQTEEQLLPSVIRLLNSPTISQGTIRLILIPSWTLFMELVHCNAENYSSLWNVVQLMCLLAANVHQLVTSAPAQHLNPLLPLRHEQKSQGNTTICKFHNVALHLVLILTLVNSTMKILALEGWP